MAESEGLSGDMLALFDRKMNDALKALGIMEGENDIIAQCGALRLRIYEAGEYVRKDTGEKVKFEAGIDIKQGSISLHVEASDIAQLIYKVRNDRKVNDAISKRLEAEKRLMNELDFV